MLLWYADAIFQTHHEWRPLIRPLVERYTNLFYDKDRNKRVPTQILNASLGRFMRTSYKGTYDGDGFKGTIWNGR